MATSDYEKRIAKLERARDAHLSATVVLVAKSGERDDVIAEYLGTLSKAALKRDQTIIVHTFFCIDPRSKTIPPHREPAIANAALPQPS